MLDQFSIKEDEEEMINISAHLRCVLLGQRVTAFMAKAGERLSADDDKSHLCAEHLWPSQEPWQHNGRERKHCCSKNSGKHYKVVQLIFA